MGWGHVYWFGDISWFGNMVLCLVMFLGLVRFVGLVNERESARQQSQDEEKRGIGGKYLTAIADRFLVSMREGPG